MNREKNDHNLTIAGIILQVRIRDIALLVIVAGSLGYVTGAVLPHLFFLEHINIALGVFVLFGMLFLVGFVLLFFDTMLFPYRSYPNTPDNASKTNDEESFSENEPHESSTQMPTKTSEEKHMSKLKDSIKNIYTLQNKEIAKLGLTDQESIIAHLLLRGDKYKDIATQMVLSENTIKYHARNVYKKAHVNSRQDLQKLIWEKINMQKQPPKTTD